MDKIIEVSCCSDCPFRDYYSEQGGSFYYCTKIAGLDNVIDDFNRINDKCPLKQDKITTTVMLKNSKLYIE